MAHINLKFEDDQARVDFPRPFFLSDGPSRFLVGNYLHGGGNSSVFEGRETNSQGTNLRTCAIKMQRILTSNRRARFQNEIRIHRLLDHPCIASFYGAGEWNPPVSAYTVPWVAMDLGGINLYQQIRQGPLDRDLFLAVAIQATEAVESLHRAGIIHRDIKPNNFVWAYEHTTDRIKMIDFGIAKRIHEDIAGRILEPQLTLTMEFVGPQSFSSPELLQYARDKSTVVDERSDLFQLGLLFWFLATGRILSGSPDEDYDPFGGTLHRLVFELTRENPKKRPQDAGAVLASLREIADQTARPTQRTPL